MLSYTKYLSCCVGDVVYYLNVETNRGKLFLKEPYLLPCTVTEVSGSFNGSVYVCASHKNKLLVSQQELFFSDKDYAKETLDFIVRRLSYVGDVVYYNKNVCDGLAILTNALGLQFSYAYQISMQSELPIDDYYFSFMSGYECVFSTIDSICNITNKYKVTKLIKSTVTENTKSIETDLGQCLLPSRHGVLAMPLLKN